MNLTGDNIPGVFLQDRTIIILTGLVIVMSCVGVLIDMPWVSLIVPTLFLGGFTLLAHLKKVYFGLFFLIPLCMEVVLPGGLSTDIPGEPILWLLSACTIALIIHKGVTDKMLTPLSCLLGIHLTWILFVSIFAVFPVIAFKYSLAKIWYLLPFYVLPFFLIRRISDVRTLLKCFVLGVLTASIYFFYQHWQLDLTYLSRTNAGQPIWRNHVNYACTLVISLPILWYLYNSSRHPDRWIYIIWSGLFLVFIYYAFARIAYLSILAAIIYSFILNLRLTKLSLGISFVSVVVVIFWFSINNHYLHLAPQYDKTIMQLDFGRKLSATAQGEDISTMERLHRWVAGSQMIKERPITGFGPANFYRSYLPYTLFSFETYVSNNPDRSGIHNYFLMLLVEQGYIGLSIFLIIIILALVKLENSYHECVNRKTKKLLLMTGTVIIMIITISAVNDMLEVIKIGSVFFFMLFMTQIDLNEVVEHQEGN